MLFCFYSLSLIFYSSFVFSNLDWNLKCNFDPDSIMSSEFAFIYIIVISFNSGLHYFLLFKIMWFFIFVVYPSCYCICMHWNMSHIPDCSFYLVQILLQRENNIRIFFFFAYLKLICSLSPSSVIMSILQHPPLFLSSFPSQSFFSYDCTVHLIQN